MTIKDNIKLLRQQKGMTLEELGKNVGVSKQTIQRYENGQIANVPYDKVVALAKVLGVSAAELMGWSGAEPPLTCEAAQAGKDEASLIKKYRALTPAHKNAVRSLVDSLLDSQE